MPLDSEIPGRPSLSVVVVVYNMPRQAPRTLYSLSSAYQRDIAAEDYEVIVVDNGSWPPLDPSLLDDIAGNFRLIRIDQASQSPAAAVNQGLTEARGEVVGVMIDGARLLTPGVLHFARHGAQLYDRAIVATLGWFLGFDLPRFAVRAGYDTAEEDALLASIGWPEDGYRLSAVGTMDGSSVDGWFTPINESNALFMRRESWELLGGLDERFDAPGGGFVNLDAFRRASELPGAQLVVLLGEGSFHQMHGGAATGAPVEGFRELVLSWAAQYEAIRGEAWAHPIWARPPTYLGILPAAPLARFVRAALDPVPRDGSPVRPLGPDLDQGIWSLSPNPVAGNPAIAAVIDLAQNELRAGRHESAAGVSRLARERAPDEPEPQRLLSLVGSWLPFEGPPPAHQGDYHLALGEAYRILGEREAALANYQEALAFAPDLAAARVGLAALRMPGEAHLTWPGRLHNWLAARGILR